jgi:predicted N-acetyltransferase YhbS
VSVADPSANQNSQLAIRAILPQDALEVCTLIEQLGYARSHQEVTQWIESLPSRFETQAAFVACIGSVVVGWIELSIERRLQTAPFAFIGGLVVKDGHRGKRIGLQLCEAAEAWSWQRGVSIVRVTSRSTRLDAHRFYERNGYRATKISQVFEKTRPD